MARGGGESWAPTHAWREILPAAVAVAALTGDVPVDTLWACEAAAVAGLPAARQREHATGRACARRALAGLAVAPQAIPSGAGGHPVWPAGVVGSITHCAGYRAAAVARRNSCGALGIDAEPVGPLRTGVLDRISSGAERARIAVLASHDPATDWGRVLFSAKESIYKAWYPLARTGLSFADADVELREDHTFAFAFTRAVPAAIAARFWQGGWTLGEGLIRTAVWGA